MSTSAGIESEIDSDLLDWIKKSYNLNSRKRDGKMINSSLPGKIDEQPKKSIFKHWYFWVIIIAIAVFAFAAANGIMHDRKLAQEKKEGGNQIPVEEKQIEQANNCGYDTCVDLNLPTPMTDEQKRIAEKAINAGITITDKENDFYVLTGEPKRDEDGRFDNYNPYPLPFTDVKSVQVGADSIYVYFKFNFYGTFPAAIPDYQGDRIEAVQGKIEAFAREGSGVEEYDLNDTFMYGKYNGNEGVDTIRPQIDHYAFISTDAQMRGRTSEGFASGGVGTNYIFFAYPLSIFNVKLGDEVTFRATTEAASGKYHHEVIDGVGCSGKDKFAPTIRYKLGSNTYVLTPQK